METTQIDYNIYQAGLLLQFAMQGGDGAVTDQLQAVSTALREGSSKDIGKAISGLQRMLGEREEALKAYLKDVIRKGS